MSERKAWTKEEDQLLLKIMQEQDATLLDRKFRWNEIAERVSVLTCKNARKGKQCRERWFNQLHPSISKEPLWTQDQEKILFRLQQEFGNHWAKISKHLPGRSDNNIKNYFYSCLRKALRKVNNFVNYNKRNARYKNLKPFQTSTLTKLLAVGQKKAENKIHIVKQEATNLAKQIKNLLVEVQVFQKLDPADTDSQLLTLIVQKIQTFNRICKRKKLKRKTAAKNDNDQNCAYFKLKPPQKSNSGQSDQSQAASESQQSQNNESFGELSEGEQKNQPLQRSQPAPANNETLSLRFPSTSSLDQTKKVRQPVIIPSCHYNCTPRHPAPTPNSQNEQIKTSIDTAQSGGLEKAPQQPEFKQLLPLIPVAHPAFYHGSGFMPTLYSSTAMHRTPQEMQLEGVSGSLAAENLLGVQKRVLQGQKKPVRCEVNNIKASYKNKT